MTTDAGPETPGESLIPLLEGQTSINELLLELGEAPVIPCPGTADGPRLF